MPRKSQSPLDKAARLLDLVPYIHAHQGIALEALAKTFGVTEKELTEDLTTLWMCGLPGYTPLELMDLSFDSGYVSIRNAATLEKPRSITLEEAVALILGLDLIFSVIPTDRQDLISLTQSLRERILHIVNLPPSISVTPHLQPQIQVAISAALADNSGLVIEYHSLYRDELSSRTILPIELQQEQGHSYLHAYCYSANDFRFFRVDRITKAEKTKVERPKDLVPHEIPKVPFRAQVLRSSRETAERFGLRDISVGEEFASSSYSTEWIERAFLASGDSLKLIAPSQMRESLAKRAQSILDRYL
jgi:proteasome accessory factor C